jgi:phosphoribosylformimino-5-aminoimidazole carboxamide ribotide isomerase
MNQSDYLRQPGPVVPVVDLMAGQVVRGVRGARDQYRPVCSKLVSRPTPTDVARALVEHFGFREVYVADLDAIAGAEPDWKSYSQIAEAGLSLWVDAGIDTLSRASSLARWQCHGQSLDRIIVGLETLPGPAQLLEMLLHLGPQRTVFSLDLLSGRPLARYPVWQSALPLDIARHVVGDGIEEMIVLDLASVGTGDGGGARALCRALRQSFPQLRITSGGGVRDAADVRTLLCDGCNRVLVASALHEGMLTRADVLGLAFSDAGSVRH